MISIEEMKRCKGKRIRIFFEDAKPIEGVCLYFLYPEEDDEENMLELEGYLINQSEIERIEIID